MESIRWNVPNSLRASDSILRHDHCKTQTLMAPRHDEDGWPLGAPAPAPPVPSHEAVTSSDEGYANLVQQTTLDVSAADAPRELIREQDRLLPAANIFRIMQRELPEGFKISRDAKYFMQVWQLALYPRRVRGKIGLFCTIAVAAAPRLLVCMTKTCTDLPSTPGS